MRALPLLSRMEKTLMFVGSCVPAPGGRRPRGRARGGGDRPHGRGAGRLSDDIFWRWFVVWVLLFEGPRGLGRVSEQLPGVFNRILMLTFSETPSLRLANSSIKKYQDVQICKGHTHTRTQTHTSLSAPALMEQHSCLPRDCAMRRTRAVS